MAPKKQPPEVAQDLSSMSIDELWTLHQEVSATLVAKMTAEKELMEDRLRQLGQAQSDANENNRAG
jgi:DNA-binding protein H-NS